MCAAKRHATPESAYWCSAWAKSVILQAGRRNRQVVSALRNEPFHAAKRPVLDCETCRSVMRNGPLHNSRGHTLAYTMPCPVRQCAGKRRPVPADNPAEMRRGRKKNPGAQNICAPGLIVAKGSGTGSDDQSGRVLHLIATLFTVMPDAAVRLITYTPAGRPWAASAGVTFDLLRTSCPLRSNISMSPGSAPMASMRRLSCYLPIRVDKCRPRHAKTSLRKPSGRLFPWS